MNPLYWPGIRRLWWGWNNHVRWRWRYLANSDFRRRMRGHDA